MSASKRQFSLALESHLELKADEEKTLHPAPIPALPALGSVLAEIGPLPREALFLGIASDGLPVLLNLHDPVPGPLFVLGEAGAGKTGFLRSIVRSLSQTHKADDLQYGILTNHPEEWNDIEATKHRVGVFSIMHQSAQDFMLSLASWAHGNKTSRQSVLMLVDDLEAVAKLDFDALQNFRWLLARGPSRRVWPIITMNADRYGQVLSWIPIFRTRIFGRIRNERAAEVLSGDRASALGQLEALTQFALRENEKWVKFWLPNF
jgi:hypothetical protein